MSQRSVHGEGIREHLVVGDNVGVEQHGGVLGGRVEETGRGVGESEGGETERPESKER